jgi:hypothetical protein
MKYLRFMVFSAALLLTAHCSLPTAFAQGTTNYPASLDDTASLPVPVDAKVATLTVGLTSAAPTATVNSTIGFPAKGIIVIDSEQIAYTGTTSTTFTGLTRGFGGTTARPHSINMQVHTEIVAAHITGVRGAGVELEKKIGIGTCNASAASTNDVLTKLGDGFTCWHAAAAGGIADPGGANDDFLQRKAGAWAYRTPAQVKTDLSLSGSNTGDQDLSGLVPNTRTVNGHPLSANVTVTPTDLGLVIGTNVEAYDADLLAIAGIAPSNDDVIQRKAGAWINRNPAQLKTDLVLVKGDVGLGNVDNTADASKPVSTAQAAADALNLKIASNLSDLANAGTARTNLGLVIGTDVEAHDADLTTIGGLAPTNDDVIQRKAGAWINRTPAQLKTDLVLVKGDVGLGSVTNDAQLKLASNLSDVASASTSRTNLGVAIGSNVQAWDADLDTLAGLTATTDNFIVSVASAWASRTPAQVKTTLALNNVDNTALSTWAGTANITTLGTIGTGTWQGTVVGSTYGGTGVNNAGRTLTISTNSGTIAFGAASKMLTVNNSIGISGMDSSTLNVGAGGTLGSAAYQNTGTSGANIPFLNGNNTWSGTSTNSVNGAISVPGTNFTGTWITGGTATTTKPYVLIEPSSATSTAWSTSGTGLGVNAASGFAGNLIDLQTNGASRFAVAGGGNIAIKDGARITGGGGYIDFGDGFGTGIMAFINKVQIYAGGPYLRLQSSMGLVWATDNAFTGTDIGFYRNAPGIVEVDNGTPGTYRDLKARSYLMDATITTAGTTGAQTINKGEGTVNFAAAATSLVVTDSLVTTSSVIVPVMRTNDSTCRIASVVPASGSFTINMTAACTAETSVGFVVH